MKDDNKVIKLVYTFFLGVLLAIFIGVGIETFYPSPTSPEYPAELSTYGKEMTDVQLQKQQEYDESQRIYMDSLEPYNRNVSIIALVSSVVLLAVSLFIEKRLIKVIADGVMLGGLFMLLYSLIRGFAAQDSKYVFIVAAVGLVIAIYLGYHRFVEPHEKKPTVRKIK